MTFSNKKAEHLTLQDPKLNIPLAAKFCSI